MEYLDLDFLEIGTSNFDTLIEEATDETKGISIEPISYYLNQLPEKKNVIKINCAIAFDNVERNIDIYYLPEHIIDEQQLFWKLKGCNKVGDYHPMHKELRVEEFVIKETIKQIPLKLILEKYNVRKITLLKIDTEGADCDILYHFIQYLKNKSKEYYPNKIIFETNFLTEEEKINYTINSLKNLGYKKVKGKKLKNNTEMYLK